MAYCYDISKVIIINTSLTLLFLPLLLLFHQYHHSHLGIQSIILATFHQWGITRFVSCFLLKEILFKIKRSKEHFLNLWILAVVNWRYHIRKTNVQKNLKKFQEFSRQSRVLGLFPSPLSFTISAMLSPTMHREFSRLVLPAAQAWLFSMYPKMESSLRAG